MAKFLAYRILEGKTTFENIPLKLKEDVKKVLIGLGHEELVK